MLDFGLDTPIEARERACSGCRHWRGRTRLAPLVRVLAHGRNGTWMGRCGIGHDPRRSSQSCPEWEGLPDPVGATDPRPEDWTVADWLVAAREGWGLFETTEGELRVQRIDDAASVDGRGVSIPQLAGDADAWALVAVRARAGSAVHRKALRLVSDAEREGIGARFGPPSGTTGEAVDAVAERFAAGHQ